MAKAATSETTEITLPQTMHIEPAPIDASVTIEAQPEEPAPQRSPREEAMARIVDRREQARAKEMAYGEELGDDARAKAAEANPDLLPAATDDAPANTEEAAPVGDAPATPAAAVEAAPEQPKRLPFDLGNGQVAYLYPEEIANYARLGVQANAALRNHQQQAQEPAPVQPAPAAPQVDEEALRAVARRLAYGQDEDQVGAVRDLVNLVRQPIQQFDPAQIRQEAAQAAYQQIRFEQNLETIGKEFPEIFSAPHNKFAQLAVLELGDLRQRDQSLGRQTPDLELYREACKSVTANLGLRGQPQPGPDQTQPAPQAAQPLALTSKEERKRAAPKPPAAANRTASLGPETPRAPTGSEIVDKMRLSRGQPAMH